MAAKSLLGLEETSVEQIRLVLDSTEAFKEVLSRPIKKLPTLRGKTIVSLFYEPSTRTHLSFELAAKRLGADFSHVSAGSSSVQKGESIRDTVRTLEAMGADLLIVRHSQAGAAHLVARTVKASVINAGDGGHEHPSQGLLNLFTVREKRGTIKGLHLAILGDIAHSRVARSDIWGFQKMGAKVTVVGPPTLIPREVEKMGVDVAYSLDEVLPKIDILHILRLQLERQAKGLFPSIQEYIEKYGVSKEKLAKAKPDLLVMHAGPMNVGLEITEEVAQSLNSAVEAQVQNGVAIRMALLSMLLGGQN